MGKPLIATLALAIPLAFGGGYYVGFSQHPAAGTSDTSSANQIANQTASSNLVVTDRLMSTERVLAGDAEKIANGETREIVCWGDSLTQGIGANVALIKQEDGSYFDASYLSYPEVLNQLTGYPTCNFGVSGATSKEIAIIQGALKGVVATEEALLASDEVAVLGMSHKGEVLVG